MKLSGTERGYLPAKVIEYYQREEDYLHHVLPLIAGHYTPSYEQDGCPLLIELFNTLGELKLDNKIPKCGLQVAVPYVGHFHATPIIITATNNWINILTGDSKGGGLYLRSGVIANAKTFTGNFKKIEYLKNKIFIQHSWQGCCELTIKAIEYVTGKDYAIDMLRTRNIDPKNEEHIQKIELKSPRQYRPLGKKIARQNLLHFFSYIGSLSSLKKRKVTNKTSLYQYLKSNIEKGKYWCEKSNKYKPANVKLDILKVEYDKIAQKCPATTECIPGFFNKKKFLRNIENYYITNIKETNSRHELREQQKKNAKPSLQREGDRCSGQENTVHNWF